MDRPSAEEIKAASAMRDEFRTECGRSGGGDPGVWLDAARRAIGSGAAPRLWVVASFQWLRTLSIEPGHFASPEGSKVWGHWSAWHTPRQLLIRLQIDGRTLRIAVARVRAYCPAATVEDEDAMSLAIRQYSGELSPLTRVCCLRQVGLPVSASELRNAAIQYSAGPEVARMQLGAALSGDVVERSRTHYL